MKNTKQIYKIENSTPLFSGYQKLNFNFNKKYEFKLYFSQISRAQKGGTIYFIDKRTAQKYLNLIKTKYPTLSPIIKKSRLNRDNLIKLSPGLYYSKKVLSNYYLNKKELK